MIQLLLWDTNKYRVFITVFWSIMFWLYFMSKEENQSFKPFKNFPSYEMLQDDKKKYKTDSYLKKQLQHTFTLAHIQLHPKTQPQIIPNTSVFQNLQINQRTWFPASVPQRDRNHLHHPKFWLNISYFHQAEACLNGHCCLLLFHRCHLLLSLFLLLLLSLFLLLCWAFLFSLLLSSCFLLRKRKKK